MNEEYIEKRNLLIPTAERFANEKCGTTRGILTNEEWCAEWNKTFHEKMNKLAREKGL